MSPSPLTCLSPLLLTPPLSHLSLSSAHPSSLTPLPIFCSPLLSLTSPYLLLTPPLSHLSLSSAHPSSLSPLPLFCSPLLSHTSPYLLLTPPLSHFSLASAHPSILSHTSPYILLSPRSSLTPSPTLLLTHRSPLPPQQEQQRLAEATEKARRHWQEEKLHIQRETARKLKETVAQV